LYTEFFHLRETPFALEPDSRFLVMADEHKEALATLIYALEQHEGWALLLGEAGVGKTTLIMALLRELGEAVVPAVITNPLLEPLDLFNMIALELGMDGPYTSKGQFLIALGQLINHCRQENKILLLVIDEAHSLTPRLLEELRLLGNLDSASPRLLNIFMVGQPKVLLLMKKAGARGLMQRLHRHYLLKPLSENEAAGYIRHRLEVAGGSPDIFDEDALQEVHQITGGIPRLINALCDESLLLAFSQDKRRVDRDLVRQAAQNNASLLWPAPEKTAADSPQPAPEEKIRRQAPQPQDTAPRPSPPLEPIAPQDAPRRREALAAAPGPGKPAVPMMREPLPKPKQEPSSAPADDREPLPTSRKTQAGRAAKSKKERRPGLGSRLAASMSKNRAGSMWRRLVFLLIVLALLVAAYLLTSQDGLRQVKRWWWIIKGRPGTELYLPDAGGQPNRKTTAPQPQRPASDKDWGPSVPVSPSNGASPPQRGSNG
jgi:general secretion pathway protein A